jgi:hypothetical protein
MFYSQKKARSRERAGMVDAREFITAVMDCKEIYRMDFVTWVCLTRLSFASIKTG